MTTIKLSNEEKLEKYIRERNKISPLTVSELRYKLNRLPPEFDDLEVLHELEYAPVNFIRKEKDDGKEYLILGICSGDDIFD